MAKVNQCAIAILLEDKKILLAKDLVVVEYIRAIGT